MRMTAEAYEWLLAKERKQLSDAGLPDEDIEFFLALSHGLPNGDIISLDLPRREGKDEDSYTLATERP